MALAAGDRLGQYVVAAPLGAGGMGEVYRATDTRLGREVAVKVLPAAVATDPDRLARFEREARTLASLSHPNIATLFGLEVATPVTDSASHAEPTPAPMTFLAMELIEGEDLAHRIAQGAMPVGSALAIARQIGAGLEAAHRAGILHRDLKPANIRIAADGAVKILDFGLAKVVCPGRADDLDAASTVSRSMTKTGTILGTAPYLSPEQALGKDADARTDIWAFGCVLFEMLTGRRPFEGGSWTAVVAHILERDPDWSSLPASVPPAVRRILRRCLAKDPRERLRDAGDIVILLEDLAREDSPDVAQAPPAAARSGARLAPWLAACAGLALAAVAWLAAPPRGKAEEARILCFTEASPAPFDMARIGHCGVALALSPDGTTMAWIGATDGGTQIFLRHLDEASAHPVPGTEGALSPFFSPDSRWLGFWADEGLKKVDTRGGVPQTICEMSHVHGVSWGDGVIVMGGAGDGSVWRVEPDGGAPRRIPISDPLAYQAAYPVLLPGSQEALVTSLAKGGIGLLDLDTGAIRGLVREGRQASYLAPGYLVWVRGSTLVAAPFDLPSRTVTGEARTVLSGILSGLHLGFTSHYALSSTGTLAFLPGTDAIGGLQLAWVTLDGAATPLPLPADDFLSPRVAPDGERLLVSRKGRSRSVWVAEPERGVMAPFTGDEGNQFWAAWTSDGRAILFNSASREERFVNIWRQPADRSVAPVRLTTADRHQVPVDVTHDGRTVVLESAAGMDTDIDIAVLGLDEASTATPLLATEADEIQPALSPDDRLLAYASSVSGRLEVYVQPFPGPGATVRVSPEGGQEPLWSPSGDRLYYRSLDGRRVLAVEVARVLPLELGRAELLFEGNFAPGIRWGAKWDIHPDGDRFLMLKIPDQEPVDSVRVIVNWVSQVEQAMAARR